MRASSGKDRSEQSRTALARGARGCPSRKFQRSRALLLLVACLSLSGCKKDESTKQVSALRQRYAALLERGAHPTEPAFTELAQKLEAIPPGSDGHARAQELLQSIRRAQKNAPPRPLAKEGAGDTAAEKESARCAELAQALGRAEGDARVEIARQLAQCREKAERLKVEENMKDHPPH